MYYLSNFTLFVLLSVLMKKNHEFKMKDVMLNSDIKIFLSDIMNIYKASMILEDIPSIDLDIKTEKDKDVNVLLSEFSVKLKQDSTLDEFLAIYMKLYEFGVLKINKDDYALNPNLPLNFYTYNGTLNLISENMEKELSLVGNTINIRLEDYPNPALRIIEWIFISASKGYLEINDIGFIADYETKQLLVKKQKDIKNLKKFLTSKDFDEQTEALLNLDLENFNDVYKKFINVTFIKSPKEIKDLQNNISYGSIRFNEKQNVTYYKDNRWIFKDKGFTYHMFKTLLERPGELISISDLFDSVIIKTGKNPKDMPARKGGPTSKYKKQKVASWHKEINRNLGLSKDDNPDVEIKLIKDNIVLRLKD